MHHFPAEMGPLEGGRPMITADQLLVHAVTYTLPFLFLTTKLKTLLVIGGTHFLIDRFRLARYVTWLRNYPWPGSKPRAPYLSAWLLIIVDNIIHVLINGAAISYIG
jgi:hypothetical protein